MPPSRETARRAKSIGDDLGSIGLRRGTAELAAQVGKYADDTNIANARGYKT